jgi:hypothetical protein
VIILFVVLRKVGIKQFFASRGEEIQKKLEELKKQRGGGTEIPGTGKRLQDFDKHKQDVIEQFKAEGLAEKERIVADARSR